jgi:hypothetical protein
MALQHLRSSTADKRPTPAAMSDGQLALNTNLVSPGLFFKDSNGDSVKIGPVHVGTTAPNATPGAGGQAGNSKGEAWLDTTAANPILKVWNGSAFVAVQPVGTGTVVSTTDTGTVTSTMILDGTILNADINASAAIVDTKLATIATAGKVSNSATTATNANTASAIVARDASGNFSAGTITAALTGNASTVTTNANLTGDVTSVGNATSIAAGVIVNADVNASAAIAGTKISPDFGSQTIASTGVFSHALGAAATPSITFTGDLNTGFWSPSADAVAASTAGSERLRVTSSGGLLIGTSSARSNLFNTTIAPAIQLEGAGIVPPQRFLSVINNFATAGDGGGVMVLGRSKGGTVGSNTVVAAGDQLGRFDFQGNDGTDFVTGATIECYVDGTPGANDMPGRLVFYTTADGASSPTERMRISNNGYSKHANAGSGAYDSATGAYHELVSDGADNAVRIKNTNATPFGLRITHTTDSNAAGNEFLACFGAATIRAAIRSNGGLANYSANNANLSDRNAKKDISLAADTWDCLKEWEIVNYRYKDQPDDADLNLGVIAQQVAESCPEVITVFQEAKEATEDAPAQEERLGVKEQQMYWMAIKALQEAQVRIEQLESKVAALEGA